jgi:hypothetical protein
VCAVRAIVGFAVLAILIECLSQRDVLRNEIILPGSFFDCGHFARPKRLSFLLASEPLPLSSLIRIGNINQISIELFFPDRTLGKVFVLSHESDFTSFP